MSRWWVAAVAAAFLLGLLVALPDNRSEYQRWEDDCDGFIVDRGAYLECVR